MSAPVTIDKNIPMPAKVKRARKAKYPIAQLQVGDSFLYPGTLNGAASAAFSANKARNLGFKFSYAEVEGGVRVWRRA